MSGHLLWQKQSTPVVQMAAFASSVLCSKGVKKVPASTNKPKKCEMKRFFFLIWHFHMFAKYAFVNDVDC